MFLRYSIFDISFSLCWFLSNLRISSFNILACSVKRIPELSLSFNTCKIKLINYIQCKPSNLTTSIMWTPLAGLLELAKQTTPLIRTVFSFCTGGLISVYQESHVPVNVTFHARIYKKIYINNYFY